MSRTVSYHATILNWTFALLAAGDLSAATITNFYDPLNRLTNAAYSDGSRESYSHDAAGNRLSRITLAATTPADSTPPSVPTNFVSLTRTGK